MLYVRTCSKTVEPSIPKQAQVTVVIASHHAPRAWAQLLPPSVCYFPGQGVRVLRSEQWLQPWEAFSPFICMLTGLRCLRKEKTCNCFCNLNNISSLETPGEKSLSSWQVVMA